MSQYSASAILGLLLACAKQALGFEVCYSVVDASRTTCYDDYHCCNGNTECCEDGLAVGAWVGIILGIIAFKTIVIVLIVRACRRHRARQGMVMRPNFTVATVGTVPPPGNQQFGNQYGNQYSTGYTNPAMQQTQKGPMSPPPAYTAP